MNSINLRDAMEEMKTENLFSLKFVSYDKRRKKGGVVKFYPEVKLIQKKKKETEGIEKSETKKISKPAKFKNSTRTVKVFVDGVESSTIRKFHVFLLIEFNGKKVYL